MHGDDPIIFEIVAVGAMATTLLLRIPCLAIFSRTMDQSIFSPLGTSTSQPRSFSSNSIVSCGKIPRSHFDPRKEE